MPVPSGPKSGQGRPDVACTHTRWPLPVPQKIRSSPSPSVQYATPRPVHGLVIDGEPSSYVFGLYTQIVSPVVASSATPCASGVVK